MLKTILSWIAAIFGTRRTSGDPSATPQKQSQPTSSESAKKTQPNSHSTSIQTPNDTDHDVVPVEEPPPPPPMDKAPWMKLARAAEGTREIPGKRHNPDVVDYFRDAGFSGIKDDETAWCAAFANAILERAGYAGSKSLAARSFLKWGKKLSRPRPGCIVVFKRGNSSWQGHVGFYVGETSTHILVLGGNQSNAVNVSRYPKSKWLGYRWPVKWSNSRTFTASAVGLAGASLTGVAEAVLPLARELQALQDWIPQLQLVGAALAIMSFMIIIYARIDDLREKGR